jgi:mono/diheme cytochrome c family protein
MVPLPNATRVAQRVAWAAGLAWLAGVRAAVAAVDTSQLPPPAGVVVDFVRDIRPIFEAACWRCHGPERPKGKFALTSREAALQGGNNGVDILPGRSADSPLIHYVARLVPDMEMPPAGKGQPLTREQIALLRAWIDQGVAWPKSAAGSAWRLALTPAAGYTTVKGNQEKFREHFWRPDGVDGGIEAFELESPVGRNARLRAEGRVFRDDYKFTLGLTQPDRYFIRGGYEQFRKYFDDGGGYYRPFTNRVFRLDSQPHLDLGRAWLDFGLTPPHWPQLVFGYEYQFKDGVRSTLQWGDTRTNAGGTNIRNIFPAAKDVAEQMHVAKFDLTHERGGWRVEDSFRAEFYELRTRRVNDLNFNLAKSSPEKFTVVDEGYQHFRGANTVRVEKQVTDWLRLGGGYLYSRLEGDATYAQTNILTAAATRPPVVGFTGGPGGQFVDRFWHANEIVLRQESHVGNVSLLLGPWRSASFHAGLQTEWMRQEGLGDVRLDEGTPPLTGTEVRPAVFEANLERFSAEENFGLRFTAIPRTVLYLDTRFRQEGWDHYEREFINSTDRTQNFLRDTDAASDFKQYRAGIKLSPWTRFALDAHAQRSRKHSAYDHLSDTNGLAPSGNGYSAFLRERDLDTDEVSVRLTLRPASWLRASAQYRVLTTDFRTVTDRYFLGPASPRGGGALDTANYDAHIVSFNLTLTPVRRLHLNSTFAYTQSRVVTATPGLASVVPYRGVVFSGVASGTFVVSEKTDLFAAYALSRGDYAQNNAGAGLPLGLQYWQHAIQAGLRRRLGKNAVLSLHYGFFNYDEPTSGGFNDYTAHSIFAMLTLRLP